MQNTILAKISKELNSDGGINTEPKVLYLLAEIRKYIEGCDQGGRGAYPNLCFYCNWVLHIRLSHRSAQRILNGFESSLIREGNLKDFLNHFKSQEKDFYLFAKLKSELQDFFQSNGLPNELLTNGKKWFNFKKLLVQVLMDCPLTREGERHNIQSFAYEKDDKNQIKFRVRIRGESKSKSFTITLKEKYR